MGEDCPRNAAHCKARLQPGQLHSPTPYSSCPSRLIRHYRPYHLYPTTQSNMDIWPTSRESTPLPKVRPGLPANLKGGRSTTQQNRARSTSSSIAIHQTFIQRRDHQRTVQAHDFRHRTLPIAFISTIDEQGVENLTPFR